MILQVDSVSSIEDITIKYVNRLLEQQAMNQHMLARSEPLDERVQRKLSESIAKIDTLEHAVANMRMMIEQQKMIIDGAAQREKDLLAGNDKLHQALREANLEIDQLKHEKYPEPEPRPGLDLRFTTANASPKFMKPLVDEDPPEDERAGPGPDRTAYAGQETPRKGVIDGDAAIREGRAALDRHNAATHQPPRGE